MTRHVTCLALFMTLAPKPALANVVAASGCFSNLISTICWLFGIVYFLHGLWLLFKAVRRMRFDTGTPRGRTQGATLFLSGVYFVFLPALMFDFTDDFFFRTIWETLQVAGVLLAAFLCLKMALLCRAPQPAQAVKGFLYPLLRGIGKTLFLLLLPALAAHLLLVVLG